MFKKITILLCLFFYANNAIAQKENDSIGLIRLDEVWVFAKEPKFENDQDRKKYLILKYRVKKVYPYAKFAAEELQRIEKVLDTIAKKREQKRYTKKLQIEFEERFTSELKKLSRSQGRVLIKLIHRQTGRSAFNLVKTLRNSWRAFWYNNTAWLYDLSLKSTYDPENIEEDFWIEDILQRSFSNDELEPQSSAIEIDYQKLEQKWRNLPTEN